MTRRNLFRLLAGAIVAPFVPMVGKSKTWTEDERWKRTKDLYDKSAHLREKGDLDRKTLFQIINQEQTGDIEQRIAEGLKRQQQILDENPELAAKDREIKAQRVADSYNNVLQVLADSIHEMMNSPTPPAIKKRLDELLEPWAKQQVERWRREQIDKFSEMT